MYSSLRIRRRCAFLSDVICSCLDQVSPLYLGMMELQVTPSAFFLSYCYYYSVALLFIFIIVYHYHHYYFYHRHYHHPSHHFNQRQHRYPPHPTPPRHSTSWYKVDIVISLNCYLFHRHTEGRKRGVGRGGGEEEVGGSGRGGGRGGGFDGNQ